MSDISPIIEKVQKLLALSKGSANANEAATAAGLANKLIDQYRLSEIDLECKSEGGLEPIEEDPDYVYESGKITAWKQILISVLAKHYGCAYWNDISYATSRKVSRFKLVGRRSDIGITRYMFSWLQLECQRLVNMQAKGCGRVFIASYCRGFVEGIAAQLKASRAEVQQSVSSAAIVKMDARAIEARDAMYKLHSNLVTSKSRSQASINANAFYAGKERGEKFHLGNSMAANSSIKMLSK